MELQSGETSTVKVDRRVVFEN